MVRSSERKFSTRRPLGNRDVIVVGSVNVDLTVRVPTLPRPGETVLGTQFTTGLGGKGANQAVAAARLGARPTFVASLGEDAHGEFAVAQLTKEALTPAFHRCPDPTGVALIGVADTGENSILVYPGANAALDPAHLDPALFVGAGVMVVQLEVPKATWQRALQLAREAGVTSVVNASPLTGITLEDLQGTDVLIVNEHEAATLLLDDRSVHGDALSACRQLAHSVGTAVITLGSRGVLWSGRLGEGSLPAHTVTAVDTTGAGDAFCGALCAALQEGLPFHEAVSWGNAAGAITATRPGTVSALPSRSELIAVLRNIGTD